MNTFNEQVGNARMVGTPIIAVRTFDAMESVRAIRLAIANEQPRNFVQWDIVRGLYEFVPNGMDALIPLLAELAKGRPESFVMPDMALKAMALIPDAKSPEAVFVMHNLHLAWHNPAVIQALWNIRDVFKTNGCTLVILTLPGMNLPKEIASDVYVIDQPLPTVTDIERLTVDAFRNLGVSAPTEEQTKRANDALIGLPSFAVEQSLAMCIKPDANGSGVIDYSALWGRKRETINSTPGLTMYETTDGLEALGGLANIKAFVSSVMSGKDAPRMVVFTDEIEKGTAGFGTDSSGTKTDLVGELLQWTTRRDVDGLAFMGVQGSGKTAIAQCIAHEHSIPCIGLNIAAMQDKHVGESTAKLRHALATIDAQAGRVLWIVTSNNFAALPSELRDRFQLGQFFFDLPTTEERQSIWHLYIKKYNINMENQTLPSAEGWNGRNIRECVKKASRFDISLTKAARYTVPIAVSAPDVLQRLRAESKDKYLSASYDGHYNGSQYPTTAPAETDSSEPTRTRKVRSTVN